MIEGEEKLVGLFEKYVLDNFWFWVIVLVGTGVILYFIAESYEIKIVKDIVVNVTNMTNSTMNVTS